MSTEKGKPLSYWVAIPLILYALVSMALVLVGIVHFLFTGKSLFGLPPGAYLAATPGVFLALIIAGEDG
jgi:hypothetical protein